MLSICQAHSPNWSRKHQLEPPASLWGKPSSSHPNAQHVLSSKENQTDGVDQTGIYWAGELKSRKSSSKTSSHSTAPHEQELVSWWRPVWPGSHHPHCLGWANQRCPPPPQPLQTALLRLTPFCTNPAVSREGSKSKKKLKKILFFFPGPFPWP